MTRFWGFVALWLVFTAMAIGLGFVAAGLIDAPSLGRAETASVLHPAVRPG